jgi:hypothetical protein
LKAQPLVASMDSLCAKFSIIFFLTVISTKCFDLIRSLSRICLCNYCTVLFFWFILTKNRLKLAPIIVEFCKN